jgi:hypothetical protein
MLLRPFLPLPRVRRRRCDRLERFFGLGLSSEASAQDSLREWPVSGSLAVSPWRGENPTEDATSDRDASVAASVDACVAASVGREEDFVKAT